LQNYKIQWKICLFLAFVLVLFGCTINETQYIRADTSMRAVAVHEGLKLYFNNIPI